MLHDELMVFLENASSEYTHIHTHHQTANWTDMSLSANVLPDDISSITVLLCLCVCRLYWVRR